MVLEEPVANLKGKAFVIMWLLHSMQRHQSQQQQQQKKQEQKQCDQNLYVVLCASQQLHQKINATNCSVHCGNMFQKQTQSSTCSQLQQPLQQIFKALLLQQHLAIFSWFFVVELQCRMCSFAATVSKSTAALAIAAVMPKSVLCNRNYRRNKYRRRSKILCIAANILWTRSVHSQLIEILLEKCVSKHRQKERNKPKWVLSHIEPYCKDIQRQFYLVELVDGCGSACCECCLKSCSRSCSCDFTRCNYCCNCNNNAYKCCRFCCCCQYYCCCCCYCCYCCCYHSTATCYYCCCYCSCVCCYIQTKIKSNISNSGAGAKATANNKCNRKGFQQHGNGIGAAHQDNHQQQQQQQQGHNNHQQQSQQHKRQYQNLFHQQQSCYHRRRRRYFYASCTSLHSYCCCFFKWICWRHHSYIEYLGNIGRGTLATVASWPLFIQSSYRECLQRLLLYLQQSHQQLESLHLQPKLKHEEHPTSCSDRQIRDKSLAREKAAKESGPASLHLNAFKTITRKRDTKHRIVAQSRPQRANMTFIKSRMYNLLFCRYWVWLIMGLLWLDGPILAKATDVSDSNNCTSSFGKSIIRNVNCSQAAIQISADAANAALPKHRPTRHTQNGGWSTLPRDWNDEARGGEEANRKQSDAVRLESIKRQILSKLGLKNKPNVTHPLPKQFIWDTIYRADGISSVTDFDFNDNHRGRTMVSKTKASKLLKYSTSQTKHRANNHAGRIQNRATRNGFRLNFVDVDADDRDDTENMYADDNAGDLFERPLVNTLNGGGEGSKRHTDATAALPLHTENDVYEADDYFGSTQEIITFAERGEMYKKHRLVEFSSPTHRIREQQLHIRHAEIHIRIEKIHRTVSVAELKRKGAKTTKLKLWIFQLVAGDYTQQGFDKIARFCTSLTVKPHELGWQKLDLTETVRLWYERSPPGEKLRLLIDCTGCGQNYMFHLFDGHNRTREEDVRKVESKPAKQHHRKNHHAAGDKFRHINKDGNGHGHLNDLVNHEQRSRQQQQYFLSNYKYSTQLSGRSSNRNCNKQKQNSHNLYSSRLQRDKGEAAAPPNTHSAIFRQEFRHLEDRLNPNRPFLVLHTEPRRAKRVRRRVIDCTNALHGQCCKESFYVSFKALGWDDWIIAPRGYFANYCRGDCSGPYRTPDTFQTFHAHFIEEYRKLGLLNGMQPCCAPVKFSSMSLIYYGDDGIIKRDLPKMVVDECGCP